MTRFSPTALHTARPALSSEQLAAWCGCLEHMIGNYAVLLAP
jgi:hypothetical protein